MAHKLLTCILTVVMSLGSLSALPHHARAQAPAAEAPAVEAHEPEPAAAATQQPAPRKQLFTPEHRREIYEAKRLSYTDAALWQLLFPGLGNIYSKQYFLAGISFVLMGFATVFGLYAFRTEQPQFYWHGAATAGLAYLGGGAMALVGVRDYNEDLRDGLNIGDDQAQLGAEPAWGVALTLRF